MLDYPDFRITSAGTKIHLLTSIYPVTDLTEQMSAYVQLFLNSHKIFGMILKDKSPSCGVAILRLAIKPLSKNRRMLDYPDFIGTVFIPCQGIILHFLPAT
jgi:hypothetical protein